MRTRALLPVLLTLGLSVPAAAQLKPQVFQAPPVPHEATPPSVQPLFAVRRLVANAGPSICNPHAEVSHNADGSVVSVKLQVSEQSNTMSNPGAENGQYTDNVMLRSYGGCLTGPLLELKPNSTLNVHLDNQLDKNDPTCPQGTDPYGSSFGCMNTINMHFHGLHVSPTGNSDNVLLNIAPSTSFDYEVHIPEDHPSGTFWYHAHRHGSTAMQVASGASGVLIIRGDRKYTGTTPGDIDTILKTALKGGSTQAIPERVFLFQQIAYGCFAANQDPRTITEVDPQTNKDGTWLCNPGQTGVVENFQGQLSSPTLWDTSGRFTSINGVVQPVLGTPADGIVKAGEVQRWRYVHAGIHDTINLQIVPMVLSGKDAITADFLRTGVLTGTPKQQQAAVAELCPILVPDPAKPTDASALVPQFEIAADGLTRTAIRPIGVGEVSVSGSIGSDFLQPGYRSDVLVVFRSQGTYCILNQSAPRNERAGNGTGPGGQGPNITQLLATVKVAAGTTVNVPEQQYIQQALYDGNKADKTLPVAALNGLKTGDLTAWRGMDDLKDVPITTKLQTVNFSIGTPPSPPTPPATPPGGPGQPWTGAFGFFVNYKSYDPDRIDFTRQIGTTDDWTLTAEVEPHIFHIHVNPFEIMDVTYTDPKDPHAKPVSIYDGKGECVNRVKDSLNIENQYCGLWHTFKDTIFVQPNYQVHIRTQYVRYIGEFVIHCHILDHEDGGMMTNIQIVPDINAPGGGLGMSGMKHMSH